MPLFNPTTVLVGNLSPETTEALIHQRLNKVGPFLSIHLCRDRQTRKSLGYAYVNFNSLMDAYRAIEALDKKELNGTTISLKICPKDQPVWKNSKGNIVVKNIPADFDVVKLRALFSEFGIIYSCKLDSDSSGTSRNVGFVQFDTEESAQNAIEKLNNTVIDGQTLSVQSFLSKEERILHGKDLYTNLEVKGLKANITEEDLRKWFEKHGNVKRVKLIHDRRDNPIAFVEYSNHEEAKKVLDDFHNRSPDEICELGSRLIFQRWLSKAERQASHNKTKSDEALCSLYVGNLADNVDEDLLRNTFSNFGELVRTQVMYSKFGARKSRGFGFVCFKNPESADQALLNMNNAYLAGNPLIVNRAQQRGELEEMKNQSTFGPQAGWFPLQTQIPQWGLDPYQQYQPAPQFVNPAMFSAPLPYY